jgi:amino acid adenylation domain-containing protein
MSDLAQRIKGLSPTKLALLSKRLNDAAGRAATETTIPRRNESEYYPLSYAQQQLWLLDQLDPGNPAYNCPLAVRMKGALDIPALEKTFHEFIRRHEILRTAFRVVEGQPVQVISDGVRFRLPLIDLRELDENARKNETKRLSESDARRSFNLTHGQLIRIHLLLIDRDEHVLILTLHHIVTDEWSNGILMRELSILYRAFSAGVSPALPALPIQYADYAQWQRSWLQEDVIGKEVSYWKKQLYGAPPIFSLPTDRPRPLIRNGFGNAYSLTLSEVLSLALRDLGRRFGATLYMVLLTTFKVLLNRYSQEEDILVGTPVAGRDLIEIEGLMGYFANTLVLRTDLSGSLTFLEALERVRNVVLDAHEHQRLPFEMLVNKLRPERKLTHTALFQIAFALDDSSAGASELPRLKLSSISPSYGRAKFDLMLNMAEFGKRIGASFEYSSELFDEATIVRLASHFKILLESVVADPNQQITRLSMLGQAERRQMLEEWNRTREEYPRRATIASLFERQVERTPDRVALEYEGRRWSYRELNERANPLARYLQAQGVGLEEVVGVYLERSPEMIMALLGILKAGASYLPLDPASPGERLAYMVRDANVEVIITNRRHQALAPLAKKVVCFDEGWDAGVEGARRNPKLRVTPDSTAYVIYTSGSTGLPKGVIATHRGMVNRLYTMWRRYPFTRDEVCCQKTSANFVDSMAEIFSPILQGVPLIIIPDDVVRDVDRFITMLGEGRVTRLVLVPSLLHYVLKQLPNFKEGLPYLKYWTVSGEPLPASLAAAFREAMPKAALLNLYGSSEVAADATWAEISSKENVERVPIGRPMGNTEAYILDRAMMPVPVGVGGELYVGGDGLARGYMNRPELTTERFMPHPFSAVPGARLYRTGDLARYRAEGELEYLGRYDQQVKIRGYRIELGEIEETLMRHEGVKEAVVVAREDTPGEKRLVCYLVAKTTVELKMNELRDRLREWLPEYMVPGAFVKLDHLPLTPNGKLDRRALPAPDTEAYVRRDYEPPDGETETRLARIWADVLKVERIGRHDNFFELGGDSILSIQITIRANEAGLRLAPRQIFEHQNIVDLALAIGASGTTEPAPIGREAQESSTREGATSQPPFGLNRRKSAQLPSTLGEIEDAYPLSPMQHAMLFQSVYAPDSLPYFSHTVCILPGSLDVEAFKRSWQRAIDRHSILRTAFIWEGVDEPFQIVIRNLDLPWEESDWSDLSPAEYEARLQSFLKEDSARGVELTKAPLIRLKLLKTPQREYELIWSCHHLLMDGWSLNLLIKEIFSSYQALREGQIPQADRAYPYRDYIDWINRQDSSRAEQFWRRILKDVKKATSINADGGTAHFRDDDDFYYEERHIQLSAAMTESLQSLARRHRLTLNTLIQGAWSLLLCELSSSDDVVFGVTVLGRPSDLWGIESIMGLFINTLPMRVRVAKDMTLLPWLKTVQRDQVEMLQYEYIPLAKIQGWSEAPQGMPLFESNVVFMNLQQDASVRAAEASILLRDVRAKTPTNIPLTLKGFPGREICLQLLYDNRRFDAARVIAMLEQLKLLLEGFTAHPETDLGRLLNMLRDYETDRMLRERTERKRIGFDRLMKVKPKVIALYNEALIKTSYIDHEKLTPLVITPQAGDVDLISWAKGNLEFIEFNLQAHGGVLFRGFPLDSHEKFDQFVRSIRPELLDYQDQHTPRTRISGSIYTSTEYPADHYVPFHSENSKNSGWPMKIWFFCLRPSQQGGETPIADNRKVFDLLEPGLREKFMSKNVMYVRNFGEGVGLPWQTVFQMSDKAALEQYCRSAGIDFEWKGDDRLKIRHISQAVATHPKTGEMVWFNQAHLFHISSLEPKARESLLNLFDEADLPANAYYGDGSPIEDEVVDHIRKAYSASSVKFPWQKGDVLMLDNMLISHSRSPYVGDRQVLVAMAEPHLNETFLTSPSVSDVNHAY